MNNFKPEELSLSLQLMLQNIDDQATIDQIVQFEMKYDKNANKDTHQNVYSVSEILNEDNVGKVVRLIGYAGEITTPYPYKLLNEDGSITTITATELLIKDIDGTSILCPNIAEKDLTAQLRTARKSKSLMLFEGTLISYFDSRSFKGVYNFVLKDIKFKLSPLDLIRERDYSEKELKDKIEYHGKDTYDGIRGYIKRELVHNLNIKGLDKAVQLDKAIDFMILQSLSRGTSSDGKYCNKLHSLVIGAPASGKKLLTIIAKILNPVAFEISSAASKVTPAGLIGNVKLTKNGVESSPGYLPLASNGIVCIQDFHELVGSRQKTNIFSILSKVMEDGEVEDSTSAKTTHKATTSIHIDMNRQSQVYNPQLAGSFEDINIPQNVLTRFDFIMEIPTDIKRQFEIVLDIAGSPTELASSEHNLDAPDWAKRLRRIVAYMATEYDSATISPGLANHIKEILRLKINERIEHLHFSKLNGIVSTRISISLHKLAKAIACSKLKRTVDENDIDEAFSFLDYKLSFLSNFNEPEPKIDRRSAEKALRLQLIIENLTDREFSKKDISNLYGINGIDPNSRTIDRDIEEMIKNESVNKIKHGIYQIVKK